MSGQLLPGPFSWLLWHFVVKSLTLRAWFKRHHFDSPQRDPVKLQWTNYLTLKIRHQFFWSAEQTFHCTALILFINVEHYSFFWKINANTLLNNSLCVLDLNRPTVSFELKQQSIEAKTQRKACDCTPLKISGWRAHSCITEMQKCPHSSSGLKITSEFCVCHWNTCCSQSVCPHDAPI